MKNISIALLVAFCSLNAAAGPPPKPGDFKKSVAFLASDEVGGRYPDSRGDSMAQRWIASGFEGCGLESPCGAGYRQPFEFVQYSWFEAEFESVREGTVRRLVHNRDFGISAQSAVDTLELEYIFIGYGIHDSLHYRMKDKAVIFNQSQVPEEFSGQVRHITLEDISLAGAKAAIRVLHTDQVGPPRSKGMANPLNMIIVTIPRRNLHYLIDQQAVDGYDPVRNYTEPCAVEPGSRVKIATKKYWHTIRSANVVALKRGTGDKYIVVGAHHDGIADDPKTGEFCPGANDNASGVAMLLQLAESLRDTPTTHNIVFAAFGREENGRVGSKYFLDHLPFDKKAITAMVNIDMVGRMEDSILYFFKTYLRDASRLADNSHPEKYGITLEEGVNGMSDHGPFLNRGVPVIYLHTGLDWDVIHTPADKEERIDYDGMVRIHLFIFDLLREIDEGTGQK